MMLGRQRVSEGRLAGATVARVAVPIEGLSLGGCGAELLEHALRSVPGVLESYVNRATETAYVTYDPARADAAALRRRIARAGFRAGPPGAWRSLE